MIVEVERIPPTETAAMNTSPHDVITAQMLLEQTEAVLARCPPDDDVWKLRADIDRWLTNQMKLTAKRMDV